MSLLAIDIGNTHTVFGYFDTQLKLQRSFRVQTDRHATSDEIYAFLYRSLLRTSAHPSHVHEVILASVVPELNAEWHKVFEGWKNMQRFVVLNCGLPWSYQIELPDPFQVGADRLADVEAALTRHRGPAIIVDAGTATTFDVVEERAGKFFYVGGVIVPGVGIALDALVSRASRLRSLSLKSVEGQQVPVVGNTTESALRSGVMHGFAALVDGMVDRIQKERSLPANTRVFATGGFSQWLREHAKSVTDIVPDLTLEGLAAIARKL